MPVQEESDDESRSGERPPPGAGVIYEKDLGASTAKVAAALGEYNRVEVIAMKNACIRHVAAGALVAALATPWAASAQQLIVYPEKGQSPQQQQQDRYQCHTWAVQQTGVDPTMATAAAPPPPPPSTQPQGQVMRGAARGAAVGAVGGAIAGDAGKGAAAGAAMGGMFGAMKRHDDMAQSQQAYSNQVAQQQAAQSQATSAYNRALGACLSGRGYTVR